MRSPVLLLMTVACCGMTSASLTRERRSLLAESVPLPDGVPLETLFASCGENAAESDIGPCVKELLEKVIDLARPSFDTGLEFGGKTVVLEPLALKDIEPKTEKKVQVSVRNIRVSGIRTMRVHDVLLKPKELGLTLNFTQLDASGDLKARYSFVRANAQLLLALKNSSISVGANWELGVQDGKLAIKLSNVTVDIHMKSLSTKTDGLHHLGLFLDTFINSNSQLLLDLFKPKMEEKVKKLLEKKIIKLGRI